VVITSALCCPPLAPPAVANSAKKCKSSARKTDGLLAVCEACHRSDMASARTTEKGYVCGYNVYCSWEPSSWHKP
jgi:hypothetical protein